MNNKQIYSLTKNRIEIQKENDFFLIKIASRLEANEADDNDEDIDDGDAIDCVLNKLACCGCVETNIWLKYGWFGWDIGFRNICWFNICCCCSDGCWNWLNWCWLIWFRVWY